MKFYDRYMSGEDGRTVYADIYNLVDEVFSDQYFSDVTAVLKETCHRVAYNLPIIFTALKNIGYVFKDKPRFSFEYPVLTPLPNTKALLVKLTEAVSDFGQVPLSLKLFYEIVGSCNFGWDYDKQPELLWEYADPIQISSIDDLVSLVSDDSWKEYLTETLEDDETQLPCLDLAADYYHKDNVSGGLPYAIELTKGKSVDSLFLNEPHETTFINYLRICMENGGFSRVENIKDREDYQTFLKEVKPKLKSI